MIYGKDERDIEAMLVDTPLVPKHLWKYTIPRTRAAVLHQELEAMGFHSQTCTLTSGGSRRS